MAEIPAIFLTSFAVGFSGAIMPGPLLVLSIRQSITQGFIAGPLVSLGHAVLELLVVIGLAVGLAQFLERSLFSFAISLVGGLFLLWMGYGMARRPASYVLPKGDDTILRATPSLGYAKSVLGGALVSLSNPYWSLWWITIGLGYIVWASGSGVAGVASFYTGHIMSDFVWYTFVATAVASGRRIMKGRVYQWLIGVCGVFLLGLALFFIYSSYGFLQVFLAG